MKRIGNLYNKIVSFENLILADKKAKKGKLKRKEIIEFNVNYKENLINLQNRLINKTYKTSEYYIFKVFEEKERIVYKLPYYPDRICHHGIMNVLEPIFVSCFTSDTYSCIKNRGVHSLLGKLKKSLRDELNTKYCLKLDIKKFYPSINHTILKDLLRKKFKDKDLLWLLDEIIDSAPGVPIGNYLSQYFANFYLCCFDHWLKENKKVKYYFRYADDLVILGNNKKELHILLNDIKVYLNDNLKLTIKENYQIFPVKSRGIDFVGYRFYHSHILLRKKIKNNFIKALNKNNNEKSIASYNGWLQHCNTINLRRKLLDERI